MYYALNVKYLNWKSSSQRIFLSLNRSNRLVALRTLHDSYWLQYSEKVSFYFFDLFLIEISASLVSITRHVIPRNV